MRHEECHALAHVDIGHGEPTGITIRAHGAIGFALGIEGRKVGGIAPNQVLGCDVIEYAVLLVELERLAVASGGIRDLVEVLGVGFICNAQAAYIAQDILWRFRRGELL